MVITITSMYYINYNNYNNYYTIVITYKWQYNDIINDILMDIEKTSTFFILITFWISIIKD